MEMSRKIVRRSLNNTMAIIVDGKDELQKYLSGYEKSEAYYKGVPDIYTCLGEAKGLATARQNAQKFLPFNLSSCQTVGISEMNKLFDVFDEL